jgi:DNA-binding CsgD family transcriptional regulator
MPSTADEESRSLSNVGLPRTDWESLFWAVFAASENPMVVVEASRQVVSANGALQRLLNRTEEELVGRSIDGSLPAADQRTIADRWRAMLARGEGHGVQELVDRNVRTTVSYAAHVAHIGGRFVILVVLMAAEGDRAVVGSDSPPAPLTPREREAIRRVALGATSREIADELFVTTETVRTHVRNAMAKTGTKTRAHLVAAAICRGLLPAISSG